ncbi:MAG TPA: serine/threonine-protein kinase [Gaiella sp.]|uniref:serine/threonine-protein kinase n=1 Tax=Gaiella sp. TaxID=2663207 RepID=UPI002D8080FA|nr:serine/threonine-protein kinase [Gaiella sp.]HET9288764.1 serine/threonine-protein kinase [Gaiella sp.]
MDRISGTPDLRLGESLGPYRLDSVLGEGAMGVVFEATNAEEGTLVALKVLKRLLSRDSVYRRRFTREARVAQEVRHRHLVPILDVGVARDHHFLAVAHVEGGSLGDRIAGQGSLSVDDTVRLAAEVGSALDALHAHGIVHRDVKPSNVMLDPTGSAAVTDFGLAKGRAYTVLTLPGQVMGTLDYIAPELIRGEEAGPASDVYALACVVYECLAGAPPFGDRRMFEVGVAHLEDPPPDASTVRPDVPQALAEVVQGAMAKEPAERPRTGTAFAHLLRAASAAQRRA